MDKKLKLIVALREASRDVRNSPSYQWGHMGSCNCGFLAQKLTKLDKATIHNIAMARSGDWREQLNEYCPGSGYPIDHLIFELLQFGLTIQELSHLECLSDSKILNYISPEVGLYFNKSADVALYMNAWADLLAEEYSSDIKLSELKISVQKEIV
jgi:hypothetical protein